MIFDIYISKVALEDTNRETRRSISIVIAAFFLTFTGCGLNFAFGVYQELYETIGGPFASATPATIDLIGTLAVSLMTMGAPLSSAWTKTYGPRNVTLAGGLILGLANVLASFGQKLWHFILTQGLLLGIGTCFSYMPAVTIAPGWFDARRGLAMGLVLSGTGIGGVVWAPLLRYLNTVIGFRNTLRLTGGLGFVIISICALALRWDPDSEQRIKVELGSRGRHRVRIPLVNWQIAKSRKFFAHACGALLHSAAYYTPVYFFSAYARTLGYSSATGANFIAASNASSAGGKILLGYAADRLGRLNTLLLCTLVAAMTALGLWLPSTLFDGSQAGKALFITFAITYGIFAGAYVSLFPTSLVELFGAQHFASVNGFLYMIRGIGTLFGTPLAGTFIHHSAGFMGTAVGYEKASIMVGVFLFVATIAVGVARFESAGLTRLKA
ncbi:MFS general substrate transporter [Rhizodiscina lignyota]|uniref:MFS general substrate transporter n=1 Tax=Rhizodiscina lignyota TaxID=1504668 RepID=A0A9P4IDK7_9PEZI|nr:MFS general substrate transporter [Rhizodiscina lignyota]